VRFAVRRHISFLHELEFLNIFIAMSNPLDGVTTEWLSASKSVTSLVCAAGCDPSAPQFPLHFPSPEEIFMARRLLILPGLLFLFSISAKAQGIEVFGGYSYERFGISPGRNLNGVEIAAQYKFADWLGAVADLDSHFGLPSAPDARTLQFLVGPQISFPARISPFVHVLAGIGHASFNGAADTSFAAAIGGGIDMRIAPLISWRIIQGDDVITRHFNGIQHNARVSTGIVLRF
jgi:hypothetical protein